MMKFGIVSDIYDGPAYLRNAIVIIEKHPIYRYWLKVRTYTGEWELMHKNEIDDNITIIQSTKLLELIFYGTE